MAEKTLPFTRAQIEQIIASHPTPFHIYDEAAIRANARALKAAFAWADKEAGGFREYFAVKALPNPHILALLKDEGFGTDCSSMAELVLSERTGIRGEQIMFTSNDTPAEEYVQARALGAIINLDDITHIDFVQKHAGLPELISFRYNPGPLREGNPIIGDPKEAKYGLTREQLFEGYRICKERGVKRFGLHTMVISNELNPATFIETASMLFELALEIKARVGIELEFVNLGGGVGIPYRPEQKAVDLAAFGEGVRASYRARIAASGHKPLRVMLECGRVITGPYGYLVARVLHTKRIYKTYVGLDASMANLMRPGMYGAYHHITVMGKEGSPATQSYDVTGSLCENNDKFAVDRRLPEVAIGDIVVIHDTGAHGHAMGFNYNGKLRSAELLLRPDGSVREIRRRETIDDLFATLDFGGLRG
jgi:diaminopimelate decarboxylase